MACRVLDPLELEAPPAGRYPISDGSRRGALNVVGRRARQDYQHYFVRMNEEVRQLTRRRNVPLLMVKTDDDPVDSLRAQLSGQVPSWAAA